MISLGKTRSSAASRSNPPLCPCTTSCLRTPPLSRTARPASARGSWSIWSTLRVMWTSHQRSQPPSGLLMAPWSLWTALKVNFNSVIVKGQYILSPLQTAYDAKIRRPQYKYEKRRISVTMPHALVASPTELIPLIFVTTAKTLGFNLYVEYWKAYSNVFYVQVWAAKRRLSFARRWLRESSLFSLSIRWTGHCLNWNWTRKKCTRWVAFLIFTLTFLSFSRANLF